LRLSFSNGGDVGVCKQFSSFRKRGTGVKHAELQRFGAIVLHFYLAWSGLETLKLEILSFLLLGGMSKGDQRQNTERDVLSS
jgi:hypothetical protein